MTHAAVRWTNASVLNLAGGDDPVEVIERRAREVVLAALDKGWSGPPFNPLKLAAILGIPVEANGNVKDARTVTVGTSLKIEFNPTQTRERIRFSLAHEVAHTLFPDAAEEVRHRGGTGRADDWQLETLCNVAAAEFVMPIGSLPPLDRVPPIETLMVDRRRYDVSAEAYLIRVAKVSRDPILVFVASKRGSGSEARMEYVIPSPSAASYPRKIHIPADSIIEHCMAIGQTLSSNEDWGVGSNVHVECVGIPGHPGTGMPRVAGFIRLNPDYHRHEGLKLVHGDVLSPAGRGAKIICQLVNDRAKTWGGGVAKAAAKKFPGAQDAYQQWFLALGRGDRLGQVHFAEVGTDLTLASLIAQEGFGASDQPRIRYRALQQALERVAERATQLHASVHMPRLGAGSAGGYWPTIEGLVRETFATNGLDVAVYDLPPKRGDHSLELL